MGAQGATTGSAPWPGAQGARPGALLGQAPRERFKLPRAPAGCRARLLPSLAPPPPRSIPGPSPVHPRSIPGPSPVHPRSIPGPSPVHPSPSQSIPVHPSPSQSIPVHPSPSQSIPVHPGPSQSIPVHPRSIPKLPTQKLPVPPQRGPEEKIELLAGEGWKWGQLGAARERGLNPILTQS